MSVHEDLDRAVGEPLDRPVSGEPAPTTEAEDRFRTAVEAISDGIGILRPVADDRGVIDDFRFSYLNGAAGVMNGLSVERMTGRTVLELYPDARRSGVLDDLRAVLEDGRSRTCEMRAKTADGRVGWFELRMSRSGGELVVVVHETTERRAAELKLRESEARFRQIAESLPQIVWTARPDGAVTYYNRRWAEFSGIPVEGGHGWGWAPAVHEDDAEATVDAWQNAVSTGSTYEIAHRIRAGDGSYRWLLSRGVPLRNETGEVTGWFGTATDIDDVKRLQEELARAHEQLEQRVLARTAELEAAHERMRALSRRLIEVQEAERRAVARELHDEAGQALTALMLGLAALERGTCSSCAGADALAELKATTGRIMSDLHALSVRLRPPALDRLGLSAALRQLGEGVPGSIEVQLDVSALDGCSLPLEIEATLYRVVQEALTNVVRHAGAARVEVRVTCGRARTVALIEDDGQGFDLDAALASGRLGLLGMRERVELVGGRLDIDSRPGAGTRVRLELPIPDATA